MTPHDSDRYTWAIETARALRGGELDRVDLTALAEEIELVGKSDAHELRSRITQILEHQLKLECAKGPTLDYNRRGWLASIERQRAEIRSLIAESPSLRDKVTADLTRECYETAARIVAIEFDVVPPQECRYTAEEILG